MQKIDAVDDATVRKGSATVKDIVDKIGDQKVSDAYKTLKDVGYLEDGRDAHTRMKLWQKNNETKQARKTLGSAMNKYMYNQKQNNKTRKESLAAYNRMGYDAIVDPEDFIWNYEQPLILINDNKFKRAAQDVIYNHGKDELEKIVDKNNGSFFTKEDADAIERFRKQ